MTAATTARDPHELYGVTVSHRAGELLGYYARCACGVHLKHEATRADAILAHARHVLECRATA